MKKSIIYIIMVFMGMSYTSVQAQQDPQYTQYMYNQAVINPAYAGSREHLSMVALYRNQWTGFDGAPRTITFSGHSPVSERVGVGLSFISDQHGPVKENNIYADISYTVPLGANHKLAFGVKGGATLHDVGLTSLALVQNPDPMFSEDVSGATPNAGAGIFAYSDKYYVGVSMPNMLKSIHLDKNGRKFGSEVQHMFATAGYVFELTDNIKFKPSGLVKFQFDAPISFDANANFLFFDRFEAGASYRLEDSFSGLVNFAITPNLRIGYAYDHIVSDISEAASSSHEIFLMFDLGFSGRVSRSPRFF